MLCIDGTEEVFAQPGSPALVPIVCLGDVLCGFWRDNKSSGHSGSEPCVQSRPRKAPKPGCSSYWPFAARVPPFANRGRGLRTGWLPSHPRDPPPIGVSPRDLDQTGKQHSYSSRRPHERRIKQTPPSVLDDPNCQPLCQSLSPVKRSSQILSRWAVCMNDIPHKC
jgi:hypothetical protein